jgi:peptide chain release factor subunit 1
LGVLTGAKLVVDEIITSGVGGKTRAGGQSARRYERLREMNLSGYYNRVAAHAKKLFLEQNKIKGLIISGPGPTKDSFLKSDYLDYRLREKILSEVDGAYSGAEGVREAVDKSSDVLKDMRVIEEKKLIQRFLSEIHKEKSLAAYGIKEVMDATTKGAVEVIIASEDLNMLNILLKCNRCSTDKNKILNRTSYVQDKQKFLSESYDVLFRILFLSVEHLLHFNKIFNIFKSSEAIITSTAPLVVASITSFIPYAARLFSLCISDKNL